PAPGRAPALRLLGGGPPPRSPHPGLPRADAVPGRSHARLLPGRPRGAAPSGPAAAGGRGDHGRDLPRTAPGDRGAALPGLRPPDPAPGPAQAGPGSRRLPPGPTALTAGSSGGDRPPGGVGTPPPSGQMRAAVTTAPGVIRLEQRPTPAIGPGEILVRVRGCGLCGSDLAKLRAPSRLPAVLGHEVVGDVVRVGEGPIAFRVGDRVAVAHHVPCFA